LAFCLVYVVGPAVAQEYQSKKLADAALAECSSTEREPLSGLKASSPRRPQTAQSETIRSKRVIDGPMSERDEILAVLRAALPDLRQRWPIRSLALFGSVARGDASAASDIDILVEFERPLGLSAFIALEASLAGLTGRRVDLVSRAALKPRIGRRILGEAVWL
jgi:uncharacterized protein